MTYYPVLIQQRAEQNQQVPWLMGAFHTVARLTFIPRDPPAYIFDRWGEGEFLVTVDWGHGRGRETVWHGMVTPGYYRQFRPNPQKVVMW